MSIKHLQLAAVCVLASVSSQIVGTSQEEVPSELRIGGQNLLKDKVGLAEFIRSDAHSALQKAWDLTIPYTAYVEATPECEFLTAGTTKEAEWKKAEARDFRRGPKIGEIFTPEILEEFKKLAQAIPNVDMDNVQAACDYLTTIKDEKAYPFFYKLSPLSGAEQYIRKAQARTKGSFNLPILDSTTPLKSTHGDDVALEVLQAIITPQVVASLETVDAQESVDKEFTKKLPAEFKGKLLSHMFNKDTNDKPLDLFKPSVMQALFYAGRCMTVWDMCFNGDPEAPEKGKTTIAAINEAKLEHADRPIANDKLKATLLAESRRKEQLDIFFSQEGSKLFNQKFGVGYLSTESQNDKDGTLAYIRQGLAKGDTYRVLPLSKSQYQKCNEGNLGLDLVEFDIKDEEGVVNTITALLVPGHASSSNSQDALDMVAAVAQVRDNCIQELGKAVYVIGGMDVNTTLTTIKTFEQKLHEFGLTNVDKKHRFTSSKARGDSVQESYQTNAGDPTEAFNRKRLVHKALLRNEGPKDHLILDEGIWMVRKFTIAGRSNEDQTDCAKLVLTDENPSDHCPIVATIALKSRKEREQAPLAKRTAGLLAAKVLAAKTKEDAKIGG